MDAQTLSLIGTVILAHFLALISPGPDFLLVVRSAMRNVWQRAIGVAFGIALANAIYIYICIIGVGAVIAHSAWAMVVLKLIGGAFLLYIAYHAIKAKRSDYEFLLQSDNDNHTKHQLSFFKEFLLGLFSGLSNPKNIIFYLSLFSVVLTPSVNYQLKIGLAIWMTLLIAVWNIMIIFVLSREQVRKIFAKGVFYIDKLAGLLLGVMGYKLIQSAIKHNPSP